MLTDKSAPNICLSFSVAKKAPNFRVDTTCVRGQALRHFAELDKFCAHYPSKLSLVTHIGCNRECALT